MKKKTKHLSFIILIVFSFYLTDQIMIYIDNQKPLMKTITELSNQYTIKAVNASIKDNTIIPGISGKEVDNHRSLINMEYFGSFNDNYLVYNKIKPDISLDDNKDKIIIKGNYQKRSVNLIVDNNQIIEDYLNETNLKYNYIAQKDTAFLTNREYINGGYSSQDFSDINSLLNKNKINKKLCLLDYSNFELCQKYNYYLIMPSIKTDNNILNIINKITSGDILLITKDTSLDKVKIILQEINRQDLKIVFLSELIVE